MAAKQSGARGSGVPRGEGGKFAQSRLIQLADNAHHRGYHEAQADPTTDTAAKRLARAAGLTAVRCPCGREFPADVVSA